jgi:hypothetical protein
MPEFQQLRLPDERPDRLHWVLERRTALIEEAKSWPSGPNTTNKAFTPIAEFPALYGLDEPLSVRLGKPGKEFDRTGDKHNPFDMTPSAFRGDERLEVMPTFRKLYLPLENVAREDPGGAEIIGALLVRCAYMLDHNEVSPGIWRYQPSDEALRYVEARTPELLGIPFRLALHFLDAIALNEDVKYVGRGQYTLESGVGRPNNVLTSARAVATFLNRSSAAAFAGDLLQTPQGVAPLNAREFGIAFRVLGPPLNSDPSLPQG